MKLTYGEGACDTVRDMRAQLRSISPGDGLVYYTGTSWSIAKAPASAARHLWAEGAVHLVQRRVGTSGEGYPVRDYIAVKAASKDRSREIVKHLQEEARRHARV